MYAMFLRQSTRCIAWMIALLLLNACGATHTAIHKRNLDVQTKMSASIFLDPVPSNQRTVFLQIRNTSDKAELDLAPAIQKAMEQKGYTVVDKLEEAHYLLQANVLQVGRCDLREAQHALEQGFGAAMGGALAGAAVGSVSSKHTHKGAAVGGLVGAAVATVTDAMVQDVIYSVVSDVQISERVGNSVEVKQRTRSKLKQGINGVQEMVSTEKVNWKRYQTRVVSTANQVNLKFDKAVAELVAGLSRAITGFF